MTFLHLAYLQQVSDLLEDKHKPLAARLGYIAKKISTKHLIHTNGADQPKLRRCKACYAPITTDNIKSRRRKLLIHCSLCGFKRKYSISNWAQQTTLKDNVSDSIEKKCDQVDKQENGSSIAKQPIC